MTRSSLLALLICAGACHPVDWKKVGADEAACLAPAVHDAVETAADSLLAAADQAIESGHGPDSAEWAADAKAVASSFGLNVVLCAAEHLIGDLFIASTSEYWVQACTQHRHHNLTLRHLPYLKKIAP